MGGGGRNSKARTFCACSSCGMRFFVFFFVGGGGGTTFSSSIADDTIYSEILSPRAIKANSTDHQLLVESGDVAG